MIDQKERATVAIIGGSGIYDLSYITDVREVKVYTPYGAPSSTIVVGNLGKTRVAFLPRHGKGHSIPPHMINYRANIWALKEMGVKWVISVSAVGSLRMDYQPGDFVVPDQFIDMTKKREYTFFDGPVVAHISMADPFCNALRKRLVEKGNSLGMKVHERGTYICIEGPRFSTRAESRVWKESFKADIIGMTAVPEVNLACEARMCYATLAMVTDYDVFADVPVTAEEVTRVMKRNTENAKRLVMEVVKDLPEAPDRDECSCCNSLENALL